MEVGKTQNVKMKKYLTPIMKTPQEMGVKMACQRETVKSTSIAIDTEKLEQVEQLENIQVSIQEGGLLQGEKAFHIDQQLAESPLFQENIQDSPRIYKMQTPWLNKKFLKIITNLFTYLECPPS